LTLASPHAYLYEIGFRIGGGAPGVKKGIRKGKPDTKGKREKSRQKRTHMVFEGGNVKKGSSHVGPGMDKDEVFMRERRKVIREGKKENRMTVS